MKIAGVILAAGLGTRMNSSLPKVLHPLHGMPMLQYVVDMLETLKPKQIIAVVGKQSEGIRDAIHGPGTLTYVQQKEPKGTGHALLQAAKPLRNFPGTVLVVNGDCPLLTAGTLKEFLAEHSMRKNDISLFSFIATDPGSYGRILRDRQGRVLSIVEDRDATAAQREIREVNAGVYAIEPRSLLLLKDIKMNPLLGVQAAAGGGGMAGRRSAGAPGTIRPYRASMRAITSGGWLRSPGKYD